MPWSSCITVAVAGVSRLLTVLGVWSLAAQSGARVRGILPCACLIAFSLQEGTYSEAERTSRRSIHSRFFKFLPCRITSTRTTTFITAVSLVDPEEAQAHQQVATIIITTLAADYFISDRVGELCSLLFIFRFEPHVLQVCCPSEYLIVYERTQPIFLDAAPNPSLSSQFPQQDPTQTTDPSIAHFSQQDWQAHQGMHEGFPSHRRTLTASRPFRFSGHQYKDTNRPSRRSLLIPDTKVNRPHTAHIRLAHRRT